MAKAKRRTSLDPLRGDTLGLEGGGEACMPSTGTEAEEAPTMGGHLTVKTSHCGCKVSLPHGTAALRAACTLMGPRWNCNSWVRRHFIVYFM